MVIHVCPKECGAKFDKKSSLEKHLAQQIPCDSEVRKYKCPNEFCIAKFTTRQAKSKHLKTCKPKLTMTDLQRENEELKHVIADLQQEVETVSVIEMDDLNTQTLQPSASISRMTTSNIDEQGSEALQNGAENTKNMIKSITATIDRRSTQFYFTEPPGDWFDFRLIGGQEIFTPSHPYWIIKIGYNGQNTGRHPTHDKEFGGNCRVIDSLITPVAAAAEISIKDRLLNENKLYSARHQNKKARDNELVIVKSQEEYEEIVQIARAEVRKLEDSIRNELHILEAWQEKSDKLEAMFKKTEALLHHATSKTKEIHDQLESNAIQDLI